MIFKYPILDDVSLIDYLHSFYVSKSKIYSLFLDHKLWVDGIEAKREMMLKKGNVLELREDEKIDFLPEDHSIEVIYEDDYLLIINKPQGIIIHPEHKDEKNTLVNLVANYYQKKGLSLAVKFAHRLDKETTGIIVFCKDMLSMSYFNHFISGQLKNKKGTINAPIGQDRHENGKRRVSKTGQEAITHYEVIKEFSSYSLVEAILETGRTHQIRVHFASIGHPILGDQLYGGNMAYIKRVALHSAKLTFIHPITKQLMNIKQSVPNDMERLIK